jgi:hypothetical protein
LETGQQRALWRTQAVVGATQQRLLAEAAAAEVLLGGLEMAALEGITQHQLPRPQGLGLVLVVAETIPLVRTAAAGAADAQSRDLSLTGC